LDLGAVPGVLWTRRCLMPPTFRVFVGCPAMGQFGEWTLVRHNDGTSSLLVYTYSHALPLVLDGDAQMTVTELLSRILNRTEQPR
jgi:hypothetical protein